MKIVVNESVLSITQKNRFLPVIGIIIVAMGLGLNYFILAKEIPHLTIGFWPVLTLILVESFFLVVFIRLIYFSVIDKDTHILKEKTFFLVNNKRYVYSEICCIYITEYGNRVMSNTCNVYLKTNTSKLIPVAIKIKEENMLKVEESLVLFLNIGSIERKKYLMNI